MKPPFVPPAIGPSVFALIRKRITERIRFPEEWHGDITALFCAESVIAKSLPTVFLLDLWGPAGSGKSATMAVMYSITGGKPLTRSTLAGFLAECKPGLPMYIDEKEGERSELSEAVEQAIRVGYRNDPSSAYVKFGPDRLPHRYPLYGPKVIAHRGLLESALMSRSYTLRLRSSSGGVRSEIAPMSKDAPSALKKWATVVRNRIHPDTIHLIRTSPDFQARLRVIVGESHYGDNRETELSETALVVSVLLGIDVDSSIRAAVESNRTKDNQEREDAAVLIDALRSLSQMPNVAEVSDGWVRITHKAVLTAFNMELRTMGLRTVTARELSVIRGELFGFLPDWVRISAGRAVWNFPQKWLDDYGKESDTDAR